MLTQHRADAEMPERVPRKAFYPKPKVNYPRQDWEEGPSLKAINEEAFREFVMALFARRNRTLRTALKDYASRSYREEAKKLAARISPPNIRSFGWMRRDTSNYISYFAMLY